MLLVLYGFSKKPAVFCRHQMISLLNLSLLSSLPLSPTLFPQKGLKEDINKLIFIGHWLCSRHHIEYGMLFYLILMLIPWKGVYHPHSLAKIVKFRDVESNAQSYTVHKKEHWFGTPVQLPSALSSVHFNFPAESWSKAKADPMGKVVGILSRPKLEMKILSSHCLPKTQSQNHGAYLKGNLGKGWVETMSDLLSHLRAHTFWGLKDHLWNKRI